jgi:hypothetical protein
MDHSISNSNNFTEMFNMTEEVDRSAVDDTRHFQKSMEFVFEVVLLSLVGGFGIVGNVGAVFLFSKQGVLLKFHRLMMMLATFDLMYILLRFVLSSNPFMTFLRCRERVHWE